MAESTLPDAATGRTIAADGTPLDRYPEMGGDPARPYLWLPPGVNAKRIASRDGVSDKDLPGGARLIKIAPSQDLVDDLIAIGAALQAVGKLGQEKRYTATEAAAMTGEAGEA